VSDPYVGTRTVMRAFLDAVAPPGQLFHPKPGGDEDNFIAGISDCLQYVFDFLTGMKIRDPYSTGYLDELEREYGITPNIQLTTAQRIATLAMVKFKRNVPSSITTLQNALDRAGLGSGGYGLTVYANDPPANPGFFSTRTWQTMCGSATGYCGYNLGGPCLAFSGMATGGGVWIANGDSWANTPDFLVYSGSPISYCGYVPAGAYVTTACCGYYTSFTHSLIFVQPPPDSWS
jgi:hypothetical protein